MIITKTGIKQILCYTLTISIEMGIRNEYCENLENYATKSIVQYFVSLE